MTATPVDQAFLDRTREVAERATYTELTEGLQEALELKRADLDDSVKVHNLELVIDVMLEELLVRSSVHQLTGDAPS